MSYTKGKWVIDERPELAGKFYSDDATGSIIGDCQHYYLTHRSIEERAANAKRIVDCVNACDGMENPADEIAKLRSARDVAIDELNRLADAFRFFIDDGERPSEYILAEWEFKAKKACA